MQDFSVPPTNLSEELFGSDTSDGVLSIDQILDLPPEYLAEGIRSDNIPVIPLDLSDRDYVMLVSLYESYCDYFVKHIGGSFERRFYEGYDIRTVLYFFQFLSVFNYATETQKNEVESAARDFFGEDSNAFQKGYLVIAAHMYSFQIGLPTHLQKLSLEELLDYYAELHELDELISHSEQIHGWGEWIIDKSGSFFRSVGRFAGKALKALGAIIGISDYLTDQKRDSVRREIKRRMDADPDDYLNYEYVQRYLRNKYGHDLPI